ncbi:GDSL-like lipase/acylhydrolase, putative [Indibacter alkaliphilus LW1]|uniref:GDSL-like lipase/acylhydrolase, putative n=1 Tax=Indibacter alkaliphilus (strain CCUG 57479 / KCTC 22604 / LW1) TaxID=1189612 RepID=S2D9Q4_INDAL|nr:SGNH/GDSL hydrolase family protein [Indibacter alkaliphilus]EOZ95594.1 GDSL-like lipase/acylhydrolase, putative [Indibacter alkaliphilus LW1]
MWNRLSYFAELVFLIPFLPLLHFEGKRLRKKIKRLKPYSEYLQFGPKSKNPILIIGESTAAGVGASSAEKTIAKQIFELSDKSAEVLNLGKNGLLAKGLNGLLRHGLDKSGWKAQRTIILIGANDCFKFTPPWKFFQELSTFTNLLQKQNGTKDIIIPSIPPVNRFPTIPFVLKIFLGWHRSLLMNELRKLDKQNENVKLLDFGVDYTQEFFAEDGIHPSDLGYEIMAKRIVDNSDILDELLPK